MKWQRELIDHPVGAKKSNKKAVKHLHKAMGELEAFYQYCGEKGDELE